MFLLDISTFFICILVLILLPLFSCYFNFVHLQGAIGGQAPATIAAPAPVVAYAGYLSSLVLVGKGYKVNVIFMNLRMLKLSDISRCPSSSGSP